MSSYSKQRIKFMLVYLFYYSSIVHSSWKTEKEELGMKFILVINQPDAQNFVLQ